MKKVIFTAFILLALPLLFQLYPLQILKLQTFDTFVKKHEPSGNFVILNITQEDIQKSGGWPFPRQELAQIHIDILNAGAIGVGWVISLPNPDCFGGDESFLTALNSISLGFLTYKLIPISDAKALNPSSPSDMSLNAYLVIEAFNTAPSYL